MMIIIKVHLLFNSEMQHVSSFMPSKTKKMMIYLILKFKKQ